METEKYYAAENSLVKTYKAEFILLLVTISWGLSFPLIKISLVNSSPFLFILIRFLLTLLLFLIFFGKHIAVKNYNEWKYGILLGVFLFAGFGFQTIGLKYTTASKSAFITGTSLILVPFLQYFILKYKPRIENIIGAVIVITGLFILTDLSSSKLNTGDIYTLLCAVSFAFQIILLDKYSKKINFLSLVFGQFAAMVIFSLISVLLFELIIFDELFINFNNDLILSLVFTSLFSTLFSILLVTKYQNKTTPVRACIIYNMEAVFAMLFAFLMLGEVFNFKELTGASIMIAGLLFSEIYPFVKLKLTGG